eukprot:s1405_g9.t1
MRVNFVQTKADIESIISALTPCWETCETGAQQHWQLARPIAVRGQTLPQHAALQFDDALEARWLGSANDLKDLGVI